MARVEDPNPNPQPPNQPPAFDPEAFMSRIMGEFDKRVNALDKKLTSLAKARPADPPTDPGGDPPQPEPPNPQPKPVDPALARMQKQIETLTASLTAEKTEREKVARAAEEKERHSSIRDVLSGHQFVNDAARDAAFRIFRDDVRRAEDGSLVAGPDDMPLKDFIAESLKQHTYLLAPRDVGGAGARGGRPAPGAKVVHLEDIKPGMNPEEFAAVAQQIQAAMQGQA